ncbi:MAG: tRNA (adenosine(37)-N6)-threonylcarbamoyltransferase complex dimerization subunit type 1 TsaB [Bacilli bacterium]|nr:tRNA (adenosine(37)-N6)-threonylcarbamoyltransferase complex dimerization subunit type 1 TsaB [Bacilli bacterium]MBN2696656.1 tRNA (adenosine(37)-N6)-threonylcarbamoyltransferase complex dimerization subunit type 1 TsaB [Bacilli bacterium]
MKKQWKRLAIDTATKYVYLSLVIDDKEHEHVYQEGINNHSVTIIPLLVEMLERHNLTLKNIDEIIVGIGPGSYTGVRIGVSIAKMIGYLNNVRVSTVSSLALLASRSDNEYVVPMIDARRGNAFVACLRQKQGILHYVIDDSLENRDEFLEKLEHPYEVVLEGVPSIEKIIASNFLSPVDSIHELVPNYLQVTEAERNRHKE